MIEAIGKKVIIKDCMPEELPLLQALDPEISALDPQVGRVENPMYFKILSRSGELIGNCTMYNWSDDEAEYGIRITNKQFWDKGYGAEATEIVTNHYLNTTIVSRIHLKVLPYNLRAIKCYEKAGFIRCGKRVVDGIEFIKMEKMK